MMGILEAIGYGSWVTHFLLWFPVVGMALVFAMPARAKETALAVALVEFLVSAPLWWLFDSGVGSFQFTSAIPWVEQWGISYSLGLDGISILLVLLTTFLMPLAVLGSYRYIADREPTFYGMLLLLQTGIIGVFIALDLFLFFVFWELMLVPMYFIIGVWGGDRRVYAAIKFFLYTAFGSLLMLVAILYLFFKHMTLTGGASFAYLDLLQVPLTFREQFWLFAAFALAFAVKVPIFPFHTWLPDAHVEAPTPGSVVLAAVLLKMGTYGFLRFALPFFPQAATDPGIVLTLMVLGVIGITYGAWVAAVQPDAKKLIAYTSVAHMGFVVLGIFALTLQGVQGAMIVMLSHGVSTGAMFLMLGMLYERRHTRIIDEFGGLASVMPVFATIFVLTALASIGLPGTSGFVGEFLALLGTFETHPWIALVATTGVIFAAYYMLPMVQRIWFNAPDRAENRNLKDLSRREMVVLMPLVVVMIWMGVYPKPFLERTEQSVTELLEEVERKRAPVFGAAPAGVELVERPEPGGDLDRGDREPEPRDVARTDDEARREAVLAEASHGD
ncbi:MAG TPA: NADH-quinone oxidoreductase subunit M [Longimicrobiales bacterium]|nr:NADH-quinone oxidoreductase subunit M [Longimicrobiales bacterium]